MKKVISVFLATIILIVSLSVTVCASNDSICSYPGLDGDSAFLYYMDDCGEPYVVDGIKAYIALPEYIETVTDSGKLEELRNDFINMQNYDNPKSLVLFSKTIVFNPLAATGVLSVSDNYLFLKCTNLNPSNATRGFSYWIYYSFDGSNWTRSFYVNKSLSVYTRHSMALYGYAPYIKIEIFSYYGTVSSCKFHVKQGGVLG